MTVPLQSLSTLNEIEEFDSIDDNLTTHIHRFQIEHGDEGGKLHVQFKSHSGKKQIIDMLYMTHLNDEIVYQAFNAKKEMASKIAECLRGRFYAYENDIYKHMKWFDPINWDDKKYALDDMEKLYERFQKPLDAAAYCKLDAAKEWIAFRKYVLNS